MFGALRFGAPPDRFGRVSSKNPSSFTRDGRELTILIPDVDSKRRSRSVKHKPMEKVKKRSFLRTRDLSSRVLDVRSHVSSHVTRTCDVRSHAGAELLLLGVPLDRERD